MNTWPTVPLMEICNPKQWPTISQNEFTESGFPVYGANGRIGFFTEFNHEDPTILITCRGATCGTINVCEPKSYVTGNAMALDDLDPRRADLRFVVHALQYRGVSKAITGTAQPQITRQSLTTISIPLPSLPEQKRIAAILDKADAIRRKRREAMSAAECLLHSWFMKTVGPDAKGFGNWQTRSIEDLAEARPGTMRTGPFGSDLKHSEFVDEGIAVLGIDNAVQNRFAWAERRYITEDKYEQLKRYRVHPGDVIITIMGTVGRSAVVPDDIPLAINTKHLACITLDRDQAEPEFLSQSFHRHPDVIRQLGLAGRGAIMTGLNLGIIKDVRLPVPPIDVQRHFARGVSAIRKCEERLSRCERESNGFFNCLVQRAFRGDL